MITAKLEIIDTPAKSERLVKYVEKLNPEFVVLDVETDGLLEKTAKLYGIGICFDDDYAFYIPFRNKSEELIWTSVQIKVFTEWLYSLCKKTKLIGHNVLYDVLVIESNLGIDLSPFIYSDTCLLKHTIDEEPPHGLKPTAVAYLGPWADKAQQAMIENIKANGGKATKENMEMYKCDTAILAEYCMWDVLLTWKLFVLFEERLFKEGLDKLFYEEEVMPLYKTVTINMKRRGFPVDVPYYQKLKSEITEEINKLEDSIMGSIQEYIGKFSKSLLDEECPIRKTGTYPKILAELMGVYLPVSKTGAVTLAKKAIETAKAENPNNQEFYDWLLNKSDKDQKITNIKKVMDKAQKKMFFNKHPDQRYVFNLKSNDHLSYLICDCLGFKALEKTPTGKNKIDDDFLETLKTNNKIIEQLLDFKKLNKLLSTYVEGILDRQHNGTIYTSMLQHGTTSGRYSSRDPNLQNQPRIKDEDSGLSPLVLNYVNAIRKGFIAGPGHKIVNADYSSLEPVCFGHMSNEEKIRNIFRTGKDLYSQVAIDVNGLEKTYSADKKADNFLKKFEPELRQLWKVPTLGIVYGMGESRLVEAIGCSYSEARNIISGYLTTYPNLKKYMMKCEYEAKKFGYVKTEFGRIRHLKEVRNFFTLYGDNLLDYRWANEKGLAKERREYKNSLNNAKNFKIQGLGAHIVNRAAIAIAKEFKKHNIDGYLALQVHDELTSIVREDQVELASKIIKKCMEETTTISIPLKADPIVADNWGEAK